MTKSFYARLIFTAIVFAGCAWDSGSHIIEVARHYGNGLATAWVYPVSIDGMIALCATTLCASRNVNKKAKFWASLGRVIGFAATLYANMVHSGWSSTDAVIVNALPGVAMIVVTELLIHAAKGTGRRH